MSSLAPPIYAPRYAPARLSVAVRLMSLAVAGGCAALIATARYLEPSASGVGSHTALGLKQCLWIQQWDMPCFSCGMTTSWTWFARGNLLASFYIQPMGMVLAVLTVAAFWVALYMAVSGKPALRLLRLVPMRYYWLPLLFFGIAAWGWKIYIHRHGLDGW